MDDTETIEEEISGQLNEEGEPLDAAPADDDRDEHGRFAAKSEEPEQDPAEEGAAPDAMQQEDAPPEEEQAPQPQPERQVGDLNRPPGTWTARAKEDWHKLPSHIQDEVKKRESDITRGFNAVREKAQFADSLMNEMRPYEALIRSQGGTPQTVVRSLLNTAYQLNTGSPQQVGALILNIAREYKADMGYILQQFQQQPPGYQDPVSVQNLVTTTIAQQLEQQRQAEQKEREEREAAQGMAEIEAFENAMTPAGQLLHPYFQEVRHIMGTLMEQGHAQTLDEAYEMGCRSVIGTAQPQNATRQLSENRRKVEEAKRAAATKVTGAGGVGKPDPTKRSLEEELAAQLSGSASI